MRYNGRMSKTTYVILKQTNADSWQVLSSIAAHSVTAAKKMAALDNGDGTYNAVAESAWGVPTGFEVIQRPVVQEKKAEKKD
jgi:hypothetical protein